jgi:hypothetical protein
MPILAMQFQLVKEGNKMTRHRLVMHCSHCKEYTIGCSLKKRDLKPKQMLKRKAPPPQANNAEEHVLIQVLSSCYQFLFVLLFKLIYRKASFLML